jgi:hypothetical protein
LAFQVGRYQPVQVVQLFDGAKPTGARRRTPDIKQRVDHQALGHRGVAADQPPQLRIQAGQKALEFEVDGNQVDCQAIEQTMYDPPEAANPPILGKILKLAQCGAHGRSHRPVLGLAQESEQTLFKLGPALPQRLRRQGRDGVERRLS